MACRPLAAVWQGPKRARTVSSRRRLVGSSSTTRLFMGSCFPGVSGLGERLNEIDRLVWGRAEGFCFGSLIWAADSGRGVIAMEPLAGGGVAGGFSRSGRRRALGVEPLARWVDVWVEKERASCCGVNLDAAGVCFLAFWAAGAGCERVGPASEPGGGI